MEKYDEGLARNVMRLFGDGGLYIGMSDKPLHSVTLDDANEVITFTFEDGSTVKFAAEGDCCSHSWIEHLEVPAVVSGRTLVEVQDERTGQETVGEYDDLRQFYQTIFRLDNGDSIKIEYRNDSNGYYGGYLVRVGSTDGDAE